MNNTLDENVLTNASGPFAPGNLGYLSHTTFPTADVAKARYYAAQYKAETGEELTFTIMHTSDSDGTETAELFQQMLELAGIRVRLDSQPDQSTIINLAIGKQYQAVIWRNYPGGDPDMQYVWWHCNNAPPAPCDNPVNFSGFNDPDINRALDEGRTNTDPATRRQDYEEINKQFATQLWSLWDHWVLWTVAYQPNVQGILGPDLPDGSSPWPSLATGHSLAGLWVTK